ncbi:MULTISPECIES: mycofactocin precursor MftA [unclassified Cryobacterium]|nr:MULTISPECIES: mycofactocin precursor MftA [unclassified Cryobacterium]
MVSAKKTSPTESATADAEHSAALDLESDTLVEEISIDGMCGVY